MKCKSGYRYVLFFRKIGLDRTVVSISHCGCDDPGSIPGLVNNIFHKFTILTTGLEYTYIVETTQVFTTIHLLRCPQGLTTTTFPYKYKQNTCFSVYIRMFSVRTTKPPLHGAFRAST